MTETYYKVLNHDGTCYHGGIGRWHLPHGKRPGKWMPKITGELRPCANGYHILKREHLIDWIAPVAVFTVEYKGVPQWDVNKGVVAQARLVHKFDTWTVRMARLFACDCADHYRDKLATYEHANFDKCVLTIRRYVFGLASERELNEARAGAGPGVWAGMWAGAWTTGTGTWARTWAWAWARTWARANKEWETNRLFDYLEGRVDIEIIRKSVTP